MNGDFTYNADWEEMEAKGTGNERDNTFLEAIQDPSLYQHITPSARKRRLDEQSLLLQLVFKRQKNDTENINYIPSIWKTEYVQLEIDFIIAYDVNVKKIKKMYVEI